MPLSAQEEAEFQQLHAEFQPAPQPSFVPRLLKNTANALWQTPVNMAMGLTGRLIGGERGKAFAAEQQQSIGEHGFQMAPPQSGGDVTADVVGQVAGSLPTYLSGARLIGGGARGLGASEKVARIIGGVGTGAVSGFSQSDKEAGIQAAEFGAMEGAMALLPPTARPILRAGVGSLTGAAVGTTGQIARGHDPTSREALIQTGIMAGLPFAMEGRGLFRGRTRPVAPAPAGARSALPDGWTFMDSVETEHGFINRFKTPEGVVERRSALKYEPAPNEASPQSVGGERAFVEVPAAPPARHHTLDAQATPPGEKPVSLKGPIIREQPSISSLVPTSTMRKMPGGEGGGVDPQLLLTMGKVAGVAGTYAASDDENKLRNSAMVATALFGGPRLLNRVRQPRATSPKPENRNTVPTPEIVKPAVATGKPAHTLEEDLKVPHLQKDIEYTRRRLVESTDQEIEHSLQGQAAIMALQRKDMGPGLRPKEEITPYSRVRAGLYYAEAQRRNLKIPNSPGLNDYIGSISPEGTHLLKPKGETGAIDPALMATIAKLGGVAGVTAASDDENKLRNSLLAAGAAFGGPRIIKMMRAGIGTSRQAHQQVMGEKTQAGQNRRILEKNFKLGRDSRLDAIIDTSQGTTTTILNPIVKSLERVAPKVRDLTPPHRAAMDEYLQSDRSPLEENLLRRSGIDPEVADVLIEATGSKSGLQQLEAHGERDPRKLRLLNNTLGQWQTNQHRAFLDPENWKADQTQLDIIKQEQINQRMGGGRVVSNRAVQRLINRAGGQAKFESGVRRDVDEWAKGIANPQTAGDPMRMQNEGSSRISRALFMKRKVLSPATQKFLGQVDDPFEREVLSIAKLAKSAPTAKLIGDIMRLNDSKGNRYAMTEKEWLDAGSPAEYLQAPKNPGLGGLGTGPDHRPMMVQRQVADVLRMDEAHAVADLSKGIGDLIVRLNRIPKGAATVWNPGTHIRNMIQFPMMAAIGGVNPLKIPKYLSRLKTDKALLRAAQDSNMFGANFGAGEFRRTANYAEHILEPWSKKPIRRSIQAVQGALKTAYGWSDNLARGSAFVKYWDEAAAKGMSGEAQRLWATEQVNRYLPNYSNVSNAVEIGRNIPFVNPFLTYTAEMTRIAKNLAEDVITGKHDRRLRSGVALMGMFTLGGILKHFAENAFLSEDQRKEFAQMEKMMPDYMRGRTNVGLGKDESNGQFLNLNLTPFLPTGDFESVARAIARGDMGALVAANPIVGVNKTPALNMAAEMISGVDSFTGQPTGEGFQRYAKPIYKAVTPSLAPGNYMANRLSRGFSENDEGNLGLEDRQGRRETPGTAISALFGANTTKTSKRLLEKRAESAKRRQLTEAREELNTVLRTNASRAEKDRKAVEYERKRQRIISEGKQ